MIVKPLRISMGKIVDAKYQLIRHKHAPQVVRELNAFDKLLEACQLADEINDYIESLDLADDTQHPLWPVVVAMRAARDKAEGDAS